MSSLSYKLMSHETTGGANDLEAIDETDSFCTDSSIVDNSVSTKYRTGRRQLCELMKDSSNFQLRHSES